MLTLEVPIGVQNTNYLLEIYVIKRWGIYHHDSALSSSLRALVLDFLDEFHSELFFVYLDHFLLRYFEV